MIMAHAFMIRNWRGGLMWIRWGKSRGDGVRMRIALIIRYDLLIRMG